MTTAIILSAGQGKRLRPLTNNRPKGMVQVAGLPIIEHQLKLFRKVGIGDIAIVQGFCAEAIPDYGVRRYANLKFAETNMVYSLFCASTELASGPVIVSYGDILYSERVLRALLRSSAAVSVVVDLDWKNYFQQRASNPYEDAESLVFDSDGNISSIGQSDPDPDEVVAQYIGLMKFDDAGLRAICNIRDECADDCRKIGWNRYWSEAYMTDLLQELANREVTLYPVLIRGEWCEIDTLKDFDLAERRVREFTSN